VGGARRRHLAVVRDSFMKRIDTGVHGGSIKESLEEACVRRSVRIRSGRSKGQGQNMPSQFDEPCENVGVPAAVDLYSKNAERG
jgi:hypothetical protein